MSINTNVITSNKKQSAQLLRIVADLIQASTNKRMSVQLDVEFNPKNDN